MSRELFKNEEFRKLWIGNLFANVGVWMQATAAAWMITDFSHSPGLAAGIQVAATAPVFIFSLLGGAMADQGSKPRILYRLQLCRSFFAIGLAVLCGFSIFGPKLLLGFTFALGIVNALTMPTWQSAISILVPRESLASAASLNNFSFNFGRAVGSTLAGVLLSVVAGRFGAVVVFSLNAISSVLLIRTYRDWIRKEPAGESLRLLPVLRAIPSGVRESLRMPGFGSILAVSCGAFALATGVWALLPLFSRDLGAGSSGFGGLMGCIGIGSLLAAVFMSGLKRRFCLVDIRTLAIGIFALSEALLAHANTIALAIVPMVGVGTAWALLVSASNTEVQLLFGPQLRARATAIYLMAFYAAMSLGSFAWGVVANMIGIRRSFEFAAVGLLGLCGLIALSKVVGSVGSARTPKVLGKY
jgi:MFS family permease